MLELPAGYDEAAAAATLDEWFSALNIGSFSRSKLDAQEQWCRLAHSDPDRRGYYAGVYEMMAAENKAAETKAAKKAPAKKVETAETKAA
jgi:hypothetical protein